MLISNEDYTQLTLDLAMYPAKDTGSLQAITYCALGLAGETGEFVDKLKKVHRGDKTLREAKEDMMNELGDVLWYLTRCADELGTSLEDLKDRNSTKLMARKASGTLRGEGDNR